MARIKWTGVPDIELPAGIRYPQDVTQGNDGTKNDNDYQLGVGYQI
jgi:hypothetical protein